MPDASPPANAGGAAGAQADVERVLELVRDMRYFVLHAPRQTGKTSALLALRELLNSGAAGDLHCVYVNIEPAQAQRENVERAMRVIVGQVASRARASGDEFLYGAWTGIFAAFGDGALQEALSRWAEESPKPLVLLIDEIDTLVGDTLISVLRQLRAGYDPSAIRSGAQRNHAGGERRRRSTG